MRRRFVVCTLLLILAVFSLTRSNFFTIKAVDVQTQNLNCADSTQLRDASQLLGQNIVFLNSSKAKENIKNKFVCVKDVIFLRTFPKSVNLVVFGRIPVAIVAVLKASEASPSSFLENIATPSADEVIESFLIDEEGVIFSKINEQTNLPSIYFKDISISLGKKLEDTTKNSLKILEKLNLFGLDMQTLVSDNYFIIFSSPKVIFRLDSEVDIQLASLQLILEKAKIDDVRLEFVDLRFDKPAVKFAPRKKE